MQNPFFAPPSRSISPHPALSPACSRSRAGRWTAWLTWASLAYLLVFAAWTLAGPGPVARREFFTDLALLPIGGAAVVLLWLAARAPAATAHGQRAWRLLALAYAALALGDLLWFLYTAVLRLQPFPSWADAGFLSFYPLLLAGLLSFPYVRERERLPLMLDAAVVLVAGAAGIWYFIVRPLAPTDSPWTTLLALAYPAGDLALLVGLTIILLRRPALPTRGPRRLLALAMIGQLVYDVLFSYQNLVGTFQSVSALDVLWMANRWLVVLAGYRQLQGGASAPGGGEAPEDAARGLSLLPYAAVVGVYGLLLAGPVLTDEGRTTPELALAVGLVTLLVLLRQYLTARTNLRLSAEEARARALTVLHATLESSADGVLVIGEQGEVIASNQRFAELWRLPPELYASGDEQAMRRHASAQVVNPQVFTPVVLQQMEDAAEVRDAIELKDGRVFERVSTPFRLQGRYAGRVFLFRDVTQRLQLEERLRQAQKMEAVGRLAGGIAHDFNNILTAIKGNAALALLDLAPEEPGGREVREIERAADRAAALTRQLLAFSRQQVMQPQVLHLNACMRQMQAMLERLLGEDVRIELQLAGDLACVRADPSQIEQVLLNLLVNARDAMPGGGTIRVETRNLEAHDPRFPRRRPPALAPAVLLAVHDGGQGIDAETRARIFEPFFTTKEQGKGTGLGLSTVYGIVEQSAAEIWVESEPGQGTSFLIAFPRVAPA